MTAYISRRVSLALFFLTCVFSLFGLSTLFFLAPVAILWFILAAVRYRALERRGKTR